MNNLDTLSSNINTISTKEVQNNITNIISNRLCHHKVRSLFSLRELLKNKIEHYLEIGVHNGCSMGYILWSEYKINCYGIDLFEDSFYPDKLQLDPIKKKLDIVNKHNHSFELIKGNSSNTEIINKVKNMNIKFDIIFIDGDHTYEGVKLDFFNYASFLKDDGLLIFDDYNKAPTNKGVFKFINDHLINNSNYEHIQFYDNEHKGEFKDGIIIFKPINKT